MQNKLDKYKHDVQHMASNMMDDVTELGGKALDGVEEFGHKALMGSEYIGEKATNGVKAMKSGAQKIIGKAIDGLDHIESKLKK